MLIKNDDYIFTSTFHGTIFSLKYHKQFVALVDNAVKVKELLEQFNITERYCQTTDFGELSHIVESDIDYDEIDIEKYIISSQKRLLSMLQ